jgi:SAM-dependent methyltransferase
MMFRRRPEAIFPLRPPLPLPPGIDEATLYDFLSHVRVRDASEQEMKNYCSSDFRRFVYTWGLTNGLSGELLELGANPYFTTMLLRRFTSMTITMANYFQDSLPDHGIQEVVYPDVDGSEAIATLPFDHFNIENSRFPYGDGRFSTVLFCEIIEHLLLDPLSVLLEIRRVLMPGGRLILTTPNVSRLENVAKMISGANIYDPYSGYGPYGRHNREYNRHELFLLLGFAGYTIESMFTADVHDNLAHQYASLSDLNPLIRFREGDLGQYIFIRAVADQPARTGKPDFLYRSYAPSELVHWPE